MSLPTRTFLPFRHPIQNTYEYYFQRSSLVFLPSRWIKVVLNDLHSVVGHTIAYEHLFSPLSLKTVLGLLNVLLVERKQ